MLNFVFDKRVYRPPQVGVVDLILQQLILIGSSSQVDDPEEADIYSY
ncbi:MAG: hypothetical protein KBS95_08540 [Alistipes sp.]|nr:hypothetical protein [Candidatus Alistipes equi]